jgi:eukaryotic-like serine/threonine-protein kinase
MEAQRWRQIDNFFHETLQREAGDREEYLLSLCCGDRGLFDEVMSLISSYENLGEFLERPPLNLGLDLLAARDLELRKGESIGPYIIQNRIGRGGMGDVYLARDQRLDRHVALKLLPRSFEDHPDWVSRFQQEARAASSIAHPNIAHIYEVGEFDGRHYIAMEYVEGVTLREHLKNGKLEPEEAIEITTQIARALVAAHSARVLHRDIKPDNIMIHRDGYVKVLDFGLAKSTDRLGDHRDSERAINMVDTKPGMIMGSPAYMSPEQARGLEVDTRTDIWSLGVVLYELLTHTSPFLSETASDTIAAILKTEPPPPSVLSPGLTSEIERVVVKLLSKARDDRYQNADNLINDLCGVSEQLKARGTRKRISESNVDTQELPSRSTGQLPELIHSNSAVSFASLKYAGAYHPKIRATLLLSLAIATLFVVKIATYSGSTVKASPITSIAVLPLINENSDPNNDYLSDGLSESLIERFSRLSRLNVIARNSSFKYKGKSVQPKDIAQDLGVQALVVGTVVQQGDELWIKVDLVDENGTNQLWSGQYRNKASDLPMVLNDISKHIAGKLNLDLSTDELNLITRDRQAAGNAYERYLKGRFYWNQLTEDALDKSIQCFNEALEIDPQYALAYAGLANSYITLGGNYRSPSATFPKAELNAQKALKLDGTLPEAHYAMAVTMYVYNWDLAEAEKELKHSLAFNPNYAEASSLLSSLSLTKGDLKQATTQVEKALERDPMSLLFNAKLAYVYYCQRDNQRALGQLQNILKRESSAAFLYNDLAKVYAQMGKFSDALKASQRATILVGQDPDTLSSLGVVYALSGKTSEARWVAKALEDLSKRKYVQAYLIASIYGALGAKDQAFTWLAKANQQRSSQMLRLKVDPTFDKIRSDRRYNELVKSMRLVYP